jgi:hypothetical protein
MEYNLINNLLSSDPARRPGPGGGILRPTPD